MSEQIHLGLVRIAPETVQEHVYQPLGDQFMRDESWSNQGGAA